MNTQPATIATPMLARHVRIQWLWIAVAIAVAVVAVAITLAVVALAGGSDASSTESATYLCRLRGPC